MADAHADVLIVGAGHAGVAVAAGLTKAAYLGDVVLVSREDVLPYERPPLSKRLLYSRDEVEPVLLRSAQYWEKSPITLRIAESVVLIDALAKRVTTNTGDVLHYQTLIWAAGGRAALTGLPGERSEGVHTIRDFSDVARLRTELNGAGVAVLGGGFIGLEAAASLRTLGIPVTLIEAGERLLGRVTGPVVSAFFDELHRKHGVDIRLSTMPVGFERTADRLTGMVLADGKTVPAQVAIVGIGMRPNIDPLLAAGAAGDDAGVDVDARCMTSLADVYAIGDCVRQLSPWSTAAAGRRIESVHNAHQQAALVVNLLIGHPVAPLLPPRFWSNQYDVELKCVGLTSNEDEAVLRGDPASGSFSVLYLREGILAAIDTINRPRDFARGQALIGARWPVASVAQIAQADYDLPRLPDPTSTAA